MVFENICRNRSCFLDEFIHFKIVYDEFFVYGFLLFLEEPQNLVENAKHLCQFLYLLIPLIDIASEEKRYCMNTFSADLIVVGIPPQKQQIQKVCADVILINSVMVYHSTQALN